MLKNFEVSAEKNKQKYEARERNTKQENAEKYKLYEIAEMLNEGKTQAEIAIALGISRQTVNRRLNEMIRANYPELLCSDGRMSNDVKQCKNNDNDNDNESDNGNGNVLENSTSNEVSSPASSNDETEQPKKEEEDMKMKVIPFPTPEHLPKEREKRLSNDIELLLQGVDLEALDRAMTDEETKRILGF